MRNLTADNITPAVKATFERSSDPRVREVLSSLVSHLHDFAREVNLTREEWLAAHDFLRWAGDLTDDRRSEIMLTSDIFGLSSLIDFLDESDSGSSAASLLGPFYEPNAPWLEVGGDLKGDNPGSPLWVEGQILTPEGDPIANATLETWQTAANGLYDSQDPNQPDPNFRCRMKTAADGRFAYSTVRPHPYSVPTDGPIGKLLESIDKHSMRPAHLHFRITAEGYRTLVTELFDADDEYINSDTVFGVREALITHYQPNGDGYQVNYNFHLAPK